MNDDILESLRELTLMTEWADIANRDKSPCLWLAARRMQGIKTTEVDCKMRMTSIESELNNLRLNRRARAMDRQDG